MNAEAVVLKQQEQREKDKKSSDDKKARDKVNREIQKQKKRITLQLQFLHIILMENHLVILLEIKFRESICLLLVEKKISIQL